MYGWFIYFRLRYDLFWSRRDINLGTTGGLCAGAYGEDNLLCNSGVLAWTPVGKQMGTRIPVRVTPHSSAHPNITGGGEGGLRARPNGVFRKTAPPKRETGRSPARGHVLPLCIDGEGWKSPRVWREIYGARIVYSVIFSFSSKSSHIGVGSLPNMTGKMAVGG